MVHLNSGIMRSVGYRAAVGGPERPCSLKHLQTDLTPTDLLTSHFLRAWLTRGQSQCSAFFPYFKYLTAVEIKLLFFLDSCLRDLGSSPVAPL